MDGLTPRSRLAPWVVVVVAVVLNLPLVTHLMTLRSLAASGIDVEASLVDTARSGEGSAAAYGVAFRFDETIDPRQTTWSAAVDRVTYQRALDTEVVEVRVLADRPAAFRIDGATTSHLNYYLTGGADVVLLTVVVALRRGGRRRPGELVLDALEDVRALEPGAPTQTGLDALGGATYLVTGEVTSIDRDAVVLDAGERRVRVLLGLHRNLVGFQQPGRVRARAAQRLPD